MSGASGPHPLRWAPPFLIGVAAATAAEVAVGLLLYDGPGLMRSLTTVLVVESAALGLGLWGVPGAEEEPVDSLRRRWLLCMVVFLGATLFSASWSLLQEVGGGALGQGLGLAAVAALPLYACGAVLSGMAAVDREDPGQTTDALGGPAALGAAAGFLATGFALPRLLTPASLFLTCLVILSAGGLIYGSVLDRKLRIRVRGRLRSEVAEVRVEDRQNPATRAEVRLLMEGPWIRRWRPLDVGDGVPWDVAVYGAVVGHRRASSSGDEGQGDAPRVLLVGGGASVLPRTAVRGHPRVRVDVAERSLEVVELAREHLDTGLHAGDAGRIRVRVGNVTDLLVDAEEGYDLVVLDTTAFRPLGGLASLPREGQAALLRCVAPDGVLAVGPTPLEADQWPVPEGWSARSVRRPPSPVREVIRDGLVPLEEILFLAPGDVPRTVDALGDVVLHRAGARRGPGADRTVADDPGEGEADAPEASWEEEADGAGSGAGSAEAPGRQGRGPPGDEAEP